MDSRAGPTRRVSTMHDMHTASGFAVPNRRKMANSLPGTCASWNIDAARARFAASKRCVFDWVTVLQGVMSCSCRGGRTSSVPKTADGFFSINVLLLLASIAFGMSLLSQNCKPHIEHTKCRRTPTASYHFITLENAKFLLAQASHRVSS